MQVIVDYQRPILPTTMTLHMWADDIADQIARQTQRPRPRVRTRVAIARYRVVFEVTPATVEPDELEGIATAVINPTRSLEPTIDVAQ